VAKDSEMPVEASDEQSDDLDVENNYEAILREIGGFGRWQKLAVVLLWVPVIYCGAAFMTYSFVLGTPKDYRYVIES